jgi:hypothetical protein
MPRARKLLYIAEGMNTEGEPSKVWVYKEGRSYYLSGSGMLGREHLCHPSVKDRDGVRREIFLVYQVKVDRFTMP